MMKIPNTIRILGVLLMIFSLSMLPPVIVAEIYKDGSDKAFIISFIFTFLTGFFLWMPFRQYRQELKSRDGFLLVVLFWAVLSFFGALPLMISPQPHMLFTDAVFEAVSGLTTTGATVISGLNNLPHAILYYRQQMQFLGGMGIIVLAVAILPMLGVGGMQLFRAETPGPMKDSKLTPRITETAKTLWYIYVGLVVACTLCYWFAGMNFFNALGESFSTISTGGFSMHDNSFQFYNSNKIEIIGIIFMILGACNFTLHFVAFQRKDLATYWNDIEFRSFLYFLAFVIGVTFLVLYENKIFPTITDDVIKAAFNVVSLTTTTGLTSASFELWPSFVPVFIMIAAIVGGCAGSTTGGIKIIRLLLLFKQSHREFKRLVHPNAIFTLKFGRHILPESITQAIWAFISVYIALFVFLTVAMMATGLDLTSAYGSVVAGLSNAGAGIGNVGSHFEVLTPTAKWIMIIAMFAGRLEIFTLLVIFTPTFWRS